MLEHPLAHDNASAWWSWDEGPSFVCLQHMKLQFHGSILVGVLDSGADAPRDGRDGSQGYHGILWVGFVDPDMHTGDHWVLRSHSVVRRRCHGGITGGDTGDVVALDMIGFVVDVVDGGVVSMIREARCCHMLCPCGGRHVRLATRCGGDGGGVWQCGMVIAPPQASHVGGGSLSS